MSLCRKPIGWVHWSVWYDISPINSLWPCDSIWFHRSESTLAQVIAWCQTDLSSLRSSVIHLRAISRGTLHRSITRISFKIDCRKFHSNLPGANDLKPENGDHFTVNNMILHWNQTIEIYAHSIKIQSFPVKEMLLMICFERCQSYFPFLYLYSGLGV